MKYSIKIVARDGLGQTNDDWHATVTDLDSGKQLIFINRWLWMLKLRLTRGRLDKAFRRAARRKKKLSRKIDNVI